MAGRRIDMELFVEPPGASVIASPSAPVLRGEGGIDHVCGACGTVVCASMREGEVDGVLFRCPACLRVNRVRG